MCPEMKCVQSFKNLFRVAGRLPGSATFPFTQTTFHRPDLAGLARTASARKVTPIPNPFLQSNVAFCARIRLPCLDWVLPGLVVLVMGPITSITKITGITRITKLIEFIWSIWLWDHNQCNGNYQNNKNKIQ